MFLLAFGSKESMISGWLCDIPSSTTVILIPLPCKFLSHTGIMFISTASRCIFKSVKDLSRCQLDLKSGSLNEGMLRCSLFLPTCFSYHDILLEFKKSFSISASSKSRLCSGFPTRK
eukprot:NODE_98_length_21025_cov_0.475055.p13 type:complete len:117 gc:universal NODE_98_length_21025_cov_0.475055:13933-14283(+)